jgi:hypothetical protein
MGRGRIVQPGNGTTRVVTPWKWLREVAGRVLLKLGFRRRGWKVMGHWSNR